MRIDFRCDGKVYTGTSGLVLPVPNKSFYPKEFQDKSRLTYYASLFNSIEINSSFYKLPHAATIQKWAESVPEDFRFTFKLWKEITHNKSLAFDPKNLEVFLERISPVSSKKGFLLVQFPPSLGIESTSQLELLIKHLKELNAEYQWQLAFEFRNRTWYDEDIFELIEQQSASVVIHDLPASASPLRVDNLKYIYLRFHGPNGGYRGDYTDDFLYEYAQYIKNWIEENKVVYAYFNNTMGNAVHNLITLNKFLLEKD